MKRLTSLKSAKYGVFFAFLVLNLGGSVFLGGCSPDQPPADSSPAEPNIEEPASENTPDSVTAVFTIAAPEGVARPPFVFDEGDSDLLDAVQRGAFNFFWNACSPDTGMVVDRTSETVISVAGVGYQLAGIVIGIERGWVSRDDGQARVLQIVRALEAHPSNRKAGLFFHFLSPDDAGPAFGKYERVVSTVDSAILFSGMLTASQYFGGEVAERCDRMVAQGDWSFFQLPGDWDENPYAGCVSLGWRASDEADPTGEGELIAHAWADAGDEHRLVAFMGVCAPNPNFRLDPVIYYRLRRTLGRHGDGEPFVWFPYSGALFTAFFAHCWIDYAHLGADDPAAFGVAHRPRVDWWENSRRTVNMHRAKAIENPEGLATPGEHAWGLTACDAPQGYIVGGLLPKPIAQPGEEGRDFAPEAGKFHDSWFDGTIAPYGAGSSIMFEPRAAVGALRFARALTADDGSPLVWDDPTDGGLGFRDAFNLEASHPGDAPDGPWAADDCISIDQGPLIIAIENARTGLVWRLYQGHRFVAAGGERLGFERVSSGEEVKKSD